MALKSVLCLKCPRCRQGNLFKSPTYSLHFTDMHTYCPNCDLQFEIEPGFFWGSMYISYALTIGLSVILSILLYILTQIGSPWFYISVITGFLILSSPYNFRLSRVIMLYLFSGIQYDPSLAKTTKTD